MELHLPCSVLTLVFITLPVFAILPVPELHFEETIIEDDDTVITCSLEYTACTEVNLEIIGNATFEKCEQKTVNQSNKVNTKKTCTLEVTNRMDKMDFICEAHFKTQSKPKKMYLQREPEFTDCPDRLVWIDQEENSFHCQATGYPFPKVTCQKGDAKYNEGIEYKTLRNMTGTYSCFAKNFDVSSKKVEVSVQYKPEVLNIKVNPPLHKEGDTVTISCEADGEPAPHYSWTTPSSDVQTSSDNRTITVQNMKKSHLGKYKCSASNKHGNHSLEQDLSLAVQPTISDLRVEPSMEVLKGDNLTVSCQANGIPAPSLQWIHPRAQVEISPDRRTLRIWNAKEEHMGNYSCSAQNKYGTATQSRKITLAVKPKVLRIDIKPSTSLSENENLILTCVAQGVPPPTYSWHLPTPNVLFSHDNSTINILAAQTTHAGDYSCTAQNTHGRDTKTQRVTVTENRGDRRERSATTILTVIFSTILMSCLS